MGPGFPRQLQDSKDVGCLEGVWTMSKRFCSILVIAIAAVVGFSGGLGSSDW